MVKTIGPPPSPRAYHSANALGPRIFIFGGCDAKGSPMDDICVLDTSNLTWEYPNTTGTKPKRGHHSAAFVGTTLYIIGGWDGSKRKVLYSPIVFLVTL
jgi:N-acetylneuraminic acid mutarotase